MSVSFLRPSLAAAVLSAVAVGGVDRPAEAQIVGSLPDSNPMKDGSPNAGPFGATGSFTRSTPFTGGSIDGRGIGGGSFGRGFGRGFYNNYPFGYGYGGYYGGNAYYPYGVGNYFNPVVGLNQGGAYLVPGPVPYYGYGVGIGLNLGNNYLGYPAYGGRYTNFGGNPNAFMMGPHRNVPNLGGGAVGNLAPGAIGPAVANDFNPVLAGAMREEADRWRAPIDLGDAGPMPQAPRPADERELADALRSERAGDVAFQELDYRKALSHYQRAAAAAPTRGEPRYKAAFARIALGQFAAAGEDLRQAVKLNPSLPVSGPSLRELFGPDHSIARTAALGGVAELARGDVRDADRLFLLGATMHANGDDRAREIFEAAWRLTGGRPHLRPYLDPVEVNFGVPANPADALAAPQPNAVPQRSPVDDSADEENKSVGVAADEVFDFELNEPAEPLFDGPPD